MATTNENENNCRVPTYDELMAFAYGIVHAPKMNFTDEEIAKLTAVFS